MSETDKGEQEGASDASPIVLVISNRGNSSYLEENEVLRVLYGDQAPRRMSIPMSGEGYEDISWFLFYPDTERAETKLKLLERFSTVPERELEEFLRSREFHHAVFQYICDYIVLKDEDIERVRVIICPPTMLEPGGPMRSVFLSFFPNAVLFTADSDRSIPWRYNPGEEVAAD